MGEFVVKGYLHNAALEYIEGILEEHMKDPSRVVKIKSYSKARADHDVEKWLVRYRALRERRQGKQREFLDGFILRREQAEEQALDRDIFSLAIRVRAPSEMLVRAYADALGAYQFTKYGLAMRMYDDSVDAILRRTFESDRAGAMIDTSLVFKVVPQKEFYAFNQ